MKIQNTEDITFLIFFSSLDDSIFDFNNFFNNTIINLEYIHIEIYITDQIQYNYN